MNSLADVGYCPNRGLPKYTTNSEIVPLFFENDCFNVIIQKLFTYIFKYLKTKIRILQGKHSSVLNDVRRRLNGVIFNCDRSKKASTFSVSHFIRPRGNFCSFRIKERKTTVYMQSQMLQGGNNICSKPPWPRCCLPAP
jgi:hypothetical protein